MKKLRMSLAIISFVAFPVFADDILQQKKIEKLSAELEALKSEIKELHSQTEAIASNQENGGAKTGDQSGAQGATLWGYGEVNYTKPKGNSQDTQMDLRRAVFGIGYKFDSKTRFVSEYEIEHAIASADDEGEVEVEQFYIDHQIANTTHIKAGLFLIPSGLINEAHEPNSYFGVERNFVETAIIPTTWREGGFAVYGSTSHGLAWESGLTTTVNLSGWDASSDEGRESPLGSIHQELMLAKAADLGIYGALNYRAVPGLVVGASLFTSQVSQNDPSFAVADKARMNLWEIHSRWTPGKWDLSALYAKGTLSNTGALNLTFAGMPTPVPKEFFGWYTQAAYNVWQQEDYKLMPFVRYEGVNTAAAYEAMPQGLSIDSAKTERITTAGASFFLNPKVVIKLDYQNFAEDDSQNRLNLGLGLAF